MDDANVPVSNVFHGLELDSLMFLHSRSYLSHTLDSWTKPIQLT